MSNPVQEKWDARYQEVSAEAMPATVLLENSHLIPGNGKALDLACGLGANALYLAGRGLEVEAWDISSVAIGRLNNKSQGLSIHTQVRDIVAQPPGPESFDLIVVCRFLERELCPLIAGALRPNGLLFYQTFTQRCQQGPTNPSFLLREGELPGLFEGLTVVAYEEGEEAMLVARRP